MMIHRVRRRGCMRNEPWRVRESEKGQRARTESEAFSLERGRIRVGGTLVDGVFNWGVSWLRGMKSFRVDYDVVSLCV